MSKAITIAGSIVALAVASIIVLPTPAMSHEGMENGSKPPEQQMSPACLEKFKALWAWSKPQRMQLEAEFEQLKQKKDQLKDGQPHPELKAEWERLKAKREALKAEYQRREQAIIAECGVPPGMRKGGMKPGGIEQGGAPGGAQQGQGQR